MNNALLTPPDVGFGSRADRTTKVGQRIHFPKSTATKTTSHPKASQPTIRGSYMLMMSAGFDGGRTEVDRSHEDGARPRNDRQKPGPTLPEAYR